MKTSPEGYHLLDGNSQSENVAGSTTTQCRSCRHKPQYNLVLLTGLVMSLGLHLLMGVRYLQGDIMKTRTVPDKSPFGMQDQQH